MRQARIHPRVLGYLGRALSLELSAVQQYLTQSALAQAWGLEEAAERFRAETSEEMAHADRIVQRMLMLNVAPNGSQLRPAGVGRSLVELLRRDLELEAEIVAFYEEAALFCRRIGDHENGDFFATLLTEERQHAAELESWLATLGVPMGRRPGDRIYF